MKNPFGRAAREPDTTQEPVLDIKGQRDREDNERFMQQLYANTAPRPGQSAQAQPGLVPPATAPTPTAAIELLEIARELLQGRDDVESKVVRVLIGRALELLPKRDQAS
jgi:hypothetical protein